HPKVLRHDVCVLDELQEEPAALVSLEVDHYTALVAVHDLEEEVEAGWDLVGDKHGASGLAAGGLDLDDVGAEVGDHGRAAGPGLPAGQVDHADALQGHPGVRRDGHLDHEAMLSVKVVTFNRTP